QPARIRSRRPEGPLRPDGQREAELTRVDIDEGAGALEDPEGPWLHRRAPEWLAPDRELRIMPSGHPRCPPELRAQARHAHELHQAAARALSRQGLAKGRVTAL